MIICGATFIFLNFFQVIYAAEPTILYNSSLTNEIDAAKALAEIDRNQVLPLVLHLEPELGQPLLFADQKRLYNPVTIRCVAVLKGRMVTGTEFKKYVGEQMYFCPKQDEEGTMCMAPQNFKEDEPLECSTKASPVMQKNQKQEVCGVGESGTLYDVVYKICENPAEYETTEIKFYSACINPEDKFTMYTSHIILSPSLLSTYLLFRERDIEYPITVDGEFKPSLLDKIDEKIIQKLGSIVNPDNPAYKLQTLVPVADMALAIWRKTTYQNFNLDWQHQNLIPLWNKINEHIRKYAESLFHHKIQIRVRTGVFSIISEPRSDGQMGNTWVKIITLVSHMDSIQNDSVAILVNNFVNPVASTSNDSTRFSNKAEEQIGNLCTKSLQDEFINVGGRVLCSWVTPEVRNLFGLGSSSSEKPWPLIEIPGINSVISYRETGM